MHTEIVPQQLKLVHAHGNSATATKLQAARNIKLQGAVSGNVNFDGTTNVTINTTQSNIAVLTGSLTVTKSSNPGNSYNQTVKNINYPSGFNKDNSVVIAFGSTIDTKTKGYSYDASVNIAFTSAAVNTGNIPREVQLNNANIRLFFYSLSTNDLIINYKIILLKVS